MTRSIRYAGLLLALCESQARADLAVSITALPQSIQSGSSSTLVWSSNEATICVGTNFDTGNETSGNASVSPTVNTDYTIKCTKPAAGPVHFIAGSGMSTATDRGVWSFGDTVLRSWDGKLIGNQILLDGDWWKGGTGWALDLTITQDGKVYSRTGDGKWFEAVVGGWAELTEPPVIPTPAPVEISTSTTVTVTPPIEPPPEPAGDLTEWMGTWTGSFTGPNVWTGTFVGISRPVVKP